MLARHGGISPPPYVSLNLSFGVGDSAENVTENRRRIKKLLGIDRLASAAQVHGSEICCVDSLERDCEFKGYDALLTERSGIGLLIQQADCQAILLHDPCRPAVGAIHCGWRGSVADIIGATIARMRQEYGTDPALLEAVISPSMGPCCGEFIDFQTQLPSYFQRYQAKPAHFDFRAASIHQLGNAGVPEQNIDVIDRCTVCNPDFFSYRRAVRKGRKLTGRQGSVICLSSA